MGDYVRKKTGVISTNKRIIKETSLRGYLLPRI